jgi:hypothetical protein
MPGTTSPARLAGCSSLLVIALIAAPARPADPPERRPSGPVPQPDPVTFEVGPRIGAAGRIGSGQSFDVDGRFGAMFGLGVAIAPTPRFTIGLAYEHSQLGGEKGAGDLGTVDLTRSLDALWASLRIAVIRVDGFSFGVTFGPGLAWQRASADVVLTPGDGSVPSAFRCSAGGSVGLGLRAGLGIEARLSERVAFTTDAVFDNLRLGSAPLDDCVPGAGSIVLFGARVGFVLRFDVTRGVR